jgi:hypothetical protein
MAAPVIMGALETEVVDPVSAPADVEAILDGAWEVWRPDRIGIRAGSRGLSAIPPLRPLWEDLISRSEARSHVM